MAPWKTHFDIGTRVSGQSRNRSRSRPQRDHPTTLHALDALRLFGLFRTECGPVRAGKALHVLAPNFFPLWDNAIADGYGVATETGYFQFINIVKQQVLPER
jgi:hypothetical protein